MDEKESSDAAYSPKGGDLTLRCKDCGCMFVFTADERAFYSERGLLPRKRCFSCRPRKCRRPPGVTVEASRLTPAASSDAEPRSFNSLAAEIIPCGNAVEPPVSKAKPKGIRRRRAKLELVDLVDALVAILEVIPEGLCKGEILHALRLDEGEWAALQRRAIADERVRLKGFSRARRYLSKMPRLRRAG